MGQEALLLVAGSGEGVASAMPSCEGVKESLKQPKEMNDRTSSASPQEDKAFKQKQSKETGGATSCGERPLATGGIKQSGKK